MKAKELLTDKSKWCQGWFCRTSDNLEVSAKHELGVKWCILGAIQKCYPKHEVIKIRRKVANRLNIKPIDIGDWNDSIGRRFQDIKDLIEELDI